MKIHPISLAFTLALGVMYSCSIHAVDIRIVDAKGKPLENTVVSLPSVAKPEATDIAIMDQIDRQFSPHVMTVSQGQRVSFPNKDNVRHHVYSFSKAKPFEIKLYSGTSTSPVIFDSPGIVVLGCNIHDNMVGYILVNDGYWSAVSDKKGVVSLPALTEATNATIWHALMSEQSNNVKKVTLTTSQLTQTDAIPITLNVTPVASKKMNSFTRRFTREKNTADYDN